MGAWLIAFNSGDRTRLDEYFQKYEPSKHADDFMGFRDRVGGFDLLSIEKSEPNRIVVLLKERNSERRALARFQVSDSNPPQVTSSEVRGIFDGAAVIGFDIDATTRSRVIDGAIAMLDEFYVFPEVAKKMGIAVRGRAKRGEYDSVTDGNAFAKLLASNFQEVSHDKHIFVSFSPTQLPEDSNVPSPEAVARYREAMRESNCAFEKVELLSGNIGYLKFNGFADPDVCGPTAIAAMNFLANVDAPSLICGKTVVGIRRWSPCSALTCLRRKRTSMICGRAKATKHSSFGRCLTYRASVCPPFPFMCSPHIGHFPEAKSSRTI